RGELEEAGLAEGAKDDGVGVAREDTGRIRQWFAPRGLAFRPGQGDGMSAELEDRRLERDAGACRGLFKEEDEGLSRQRVARNAATSVRLVLGGSVEDAPGRVQGKIGEPKEMPRHHGNSRSDSKSCSTVGMRAASSRARCAASQRNSIWWATAIGPVLPRLTFRSTEASTAAVARISSSKRGSMVRARAGSTFSSGMPRWRQTCTSSPTMR